MKNILLVDDQAIIRLLVSAALEERGYAVISAADGDEALQIARVQKPDLILLDLAMPRVDGFTVLRCLRKSASLREIPVIILTEANNKEDICRIARLKVNAYILKATFDSQKFIECVDEIVHSSKSPIEENRDRALCAPAERDQILTRPVQDGSARLQNITPLLEHGEMMTLLRKSSGLRALSPIAAEVSRMLRKTTCSLAEITKVIHSDPAIVSRIMQLANSSAFAHAGRVETIERAVANIGARRIEEVVINLSVIDSLSGKAYGDQIDVLAFWEHSITCAAMSAEICRARGGSEEQVQGAMLVGLLHDAGRLVFIDALGDRYTQVIDRAREFRLPLEMVEMHLLRVDHARAMKQVLANWMFPPTLAMPIANHHRSLAEVRRLAGDYVEEVAICGLANHLTHILLRGESGNPILSPTGEYIEELGLAAEAMSSLADGIQEMTSELKMVLFSQQVNEVWPDQRKSVIRQLGKPVDTVVLGTGTAFDTHALFFKQLANEEGQTTPQLAVMLVEKASQVTPLCEQLLRQEQEASWPTLPLLIVTAMDQLVVPIGLLARRSVELLPPTVHLLDVIDAVSKILGRQIEKRGAA